MRGVIKNIKQGNSEILVKPDHGSDTPIDTDVFNSNLLFMDFDDEEAKKYEKELKEMLLKNPPCGHAVCFVGDRVSYKKTGPGEYAINKLLVCEGDPRLGNPNVEIEEGKKFKFRG